MCFVSVSKIERVENPDFVQDFKFYKEAPSSDRTSGPGLQANHSLSISAMVYARGKLVDTCRTLAENQPILPATAENLKLVDPDRTVVITDALGVMLLNHLSPETFHPDIITRDSNIFLRNKIYMFQLKDFSCVMEMSLHPIRPEDLEDGVLGALDLRLRVNLDYDKIWVFEYNDDMLRKQS